MDQAINETLKRIDDSQSSESESGFETETKPQKHLSGKNLENKEIEETKATPLVMPVSETPETNFDTQPFMTGNAMSEEMVSMAKFKEL